MRPPLILMLSKTNPTLCQMAAAILEREIGDLARIECSTEKFSAPTDPIAFRAMAELGYDLNRQSCMSIGELSDDFVETAITLGDVDDGAAFSALTRRHAWVFEDPSAILGEEQKLAAYRALRRDMVRVLGAYAAGRRDEAIRRQAELDVAMRAG